MCFFFLLLPKETLTAAKPIIAIPFFGDQPENAQLLKEYGAAELIGKIPTGAEKEPNPYKEGWITEESVSSAVIKAWKVCPTRPPPFPLRTTMEPQNHWVVEENGLPPVNSQVGEVFCRLRAVRVDPAC